MRKSYHHNSVFYFNGVIRMDYFAEISFLVGRSTRGVEVFFAGLRKAYRFVSLQFLHSTDANLLCPASYSVMNTG